VHNRLTAPVSPVDVSDFASEASARLSAVSTMVGRLDEHLDDDESADGYTVAILQDVIEDVAEGLKRLAKIILKMGEFDPQTDPQAAGRGRK
jgi:hypothetical protein